MKRSKISNSLYNWASLFKVIGILGLIVGFFIWAAEPKDGPGVMIAGLSLTIAGVLANGLAVIAEASIKYLERTEKEENEEKLRKANAEPVQEPSTPSLTE